MTVPSRSSTVGTTLWVTGGRRRVNGAELLGTGTLVPSRPWRPHRSSPAPVDEPDARHLGFPASSTLSTAPTTMTNLSLS